MWMFTMTIQSNGKDFEMLSFLKLYFTYLVVVINFTFSIHFLKRLIFYLTLVFFGCGLFFLKCNFQIKIFK